MLFSANAVINHIDGFLLQLSVIIICKRLALPFIYAILSTYTTCRVSICMSVYMFVWTYVSKCVYLLHVAALALKKLVVSRIYGNFGVHENIHDIKLYNVYSNC